MTAVGCAFGRGAWEVRLRAVRTVRLGLLLAAALGLGLAGGWFLARWGPALIGPRPFAGTAVVLQIQGLAELSTVRYVIEKIVLVEDARFYGVNRVVLVAHGIVRAGVDLAKLGEADIRIDGPRVEVLLPAPEILDAHLDEEQTRVLDDSSGLFRRFDKNLQQEARRKGLEQVRRAALESGILEEARRRARLELENLLRRLGFTEIDVRFRDEAAAVDEGGVALSGSRAAGKPD